jgi:Ser-tRNA(Ala) deacylase AlaX
MTDIFPVEQVLNDKTLGKLAKNIQPGLKEIRVVEIEMFDKQIDNGTHVKFTKEVGKIEFLSVENSGINNKIYFKVQ